MIQNIFALAIVFLAAGISIFSVIKSLISKNGTHCNGCTACDTNTQRKLKMNVFKDGANINYKDLVFHNKRK